MMGSVSPGNARREWAGSAAIPATVRLMPRMAQETAVHRWDAQLAHRRAEPIEAERVRDGIDGDTTLVERHFEPVPPD